MKNSITPIRSIDSRAQPGVLGVIRFLLTVSLLFVLICIFCGIIMFKLMPLFLD